MRTIEARATITDDRRLVLQLPQDAVPGEHDVVVLFDVRRPARIGDRNPTSLGRRFAGLWR